MIDASRRLLATAAALLLVVTLTSADGLPAAVTDPPADDPTEVDWRLLATLEYRTGEVGAELAALDGTLVKVPGFTVPLEDFATSVTEFLLVPYVGACIHTPPPPPNQLVYIDMERGQRAELDGWNPVWVEGVLEIKMANSVYGNVGFTITGQRVYPYK